MPMAPARRALHRKRRQRRREPPHPASRTAQRAYQTSRASSARCFLLPHPCRELGRRRDERRRRDARRREEGCAGGVRGGVRSGGGGAARRRRRRAHRSAQQSPHPRAVPRGSATDARRGVGGKKGACAAVRRRVREEHVLSWVLVSGLWSWSWSWVLVLSFLRCLVRVRTEH